jgi:transcriptional regulator with XRE-family HTH domain
MTITYPENMRRAIKKRITDAGFKTQAEVAFRAGMTPQQLSAFMLRGGTVRTLWRVALALHTTPAELFKMAQEASDEA